MSNGDSQSFQNIARIELILENCCKSIWLRGYSPTKLNGLNLYKQYNKMIDL